MTGVLYIIPYLQQPCPITGGFVVYENINIYLKKRVPIVFPKCSHSYWSTKQEVHYLVFF